MKLSKVVKIHRKKLGLTLEQLSDKTGLSKGFLSRLEGGDFNQKNISLATIIKLSNGFNIKVKEILDSLEIVEQNESPPLNVYLREKYDIKNEGDLKVIEGLLIRLKRNGHEAI